MNFRAIVCHPQLFIERFVDLLRKHQRHNAIVYACGIKRNRFRRIRRLYKPDSARRNVRDKLLAHCLQLAERHLATVVHDSDSVVVEVEDSAWRLVTGAWHGSFLTFGLWLYYVHCIGVRPEAVDFLGRERTAEFALKCRDERHLPGRVPSRMFLVLHRNGLFRRYGEHAAEYVGKSVVMQLRTFDIRLRAFNFKL